MGSSILISFIDDTGGLGAPTARSGFFRTWAACICPKPLRRSSFFLRLFSSKLHSMPFTA